MPCGHGIPPDTLLGYAESQFKAGHEMVRCPHIVDGSNTQCGAEWQWPLIRFVLSQSGIGSDSEKLLALGVRTARNTLNGQCRVKACPHCQHTLYRQRHDADSQSDSAQCPMCSTKFSWSESSGFEREVYAILAECGTKTIGCVQGVPSIRACPDCSQLIGHTDACKHMQCPRCRLDFCFVCLKKKKNGEWQCGSHRAICAVAERQTKVNPSDMADWFSLL